MAARTRLPHAQSRRAAASAAPPRRTDTLILSGTLVLAILVYAWTLGNGSVVLGEPSTAWYTTPDLSPALDHAVNLVLHLGCVALVFFVIRSLTDRVFLAHFCAVAIAVHPMNVDAVAGVDPRGGLLAALFVLGALLAYLRYLAPPASPGGGGRWLLLGFAVVFGAVAGLASSASAIALPLLLLLVDAFLGRLRPAWPGAQPPGARPLGGRRLDAASLPGGWAQVVAEKLPFVAVSVGVLLLASGEFAFNGVLVVCAAVVTYVCKLFLPVHLALAYSRPSGWFLYAAPLLLIVMIGLPLLIRSARRTVLFGLGFFLAAILPSAAIAPTGTAPANAAMLPDGPAGGYAANGLAYLPYVGLFLILGHFVGVLLARHSADVRVQSVAVGLLAGVVLVFSVISVLRAVSWHDTVRATTASIGVDPGVAGVYVARAGAEYAAGDYKAARQDVETALALDTGNAWAYVYRGRLKYAASDFTGAIDDFDDAVARAPRLAVAYVDRGRARSANQDSVGALSDFSWAIGLDPDLADAYHQRGIVEIQVSNEKAAVADFDRVLELRPGYADAYYYRGVAKARLNDMGSACADLHEAQGLGQKQAATALSQSCQGK